MNGFAPASERVPGSAAERPPVPRPARTSGMPQARGLRPSRVPAQSAGPAPDVMDVMDVLRRSAGVPLAPGVRAEAETALGADLSAVRVHTDEQADRSAAALNAQAYTSGSHIAFRRGRFDPASQGGRHLLLHEAAHVLQQRQGLVPAARAARVTVSQPGDSLEREADTRAAAALRDGTPAAPRRAAGPAAPAPGRSIQRSVGLELEHSVPIYRDLAPKDQEQSLREGSYQYDNAAPVYHTGNIVVKVDNNSYSGYLAAYLRKNNPRKLKNEIPDKGISIAEYTTQAPGLDELAAGAKGAFTQHVQLIEQEIKRNEQGRHVPGVYYVGLPPGIPRNLASFGDRRGLQVTVGVFPSKLDRLHRLALKGGLVDRTPYTVQETISDIMDGTLKNVVDGISGELGKLVDVSGDFWAPARLKLVHGPGAPPNLAPLEGSIQPAAVILKRVFSDTVRSIFRVALSYYLGARRRDSDVTEKSAVALLARGELHTVFTQAGLQPLPAAITTPAASLGNPQEFFADHFEQEVRKHETAIEEGVEEARKQLGGTARAHADILADLSMTELMINLVRGKRFHHTGPGSTLTAPDPLDITGQGVAEPIRPEAGGSQFEYRTMPVGSGLGKFIDIGEMVFELNTEHLPPDARATLRARAGW